MTTRFFTTVLLFLTIALSTLADDKPAAQPADDQVEKERATLALELCRKAAHEYRLCLDDAKRTELELKDDPLLRWSNPAVGSIHGGVFIWTHRGRPVAVASIFKWFSPLDSMAFEVHSLSTERLIGIRGTSEIWKSSRPGVEFKPVAGAPVPAGTPAARLSQMRTISNDFTVDKTDRDESQTQQRMRLLTQPIFRYASQAEHVTDGGLFGFVQGTDPEVFLILEARETDAGSAWHYALARMNSTIFKVNYREKEVWAVDVIPWGIVLNNREPYNILNLDHFYAPKK
jgi:hypothetical protein